ncbi:MAG: HzsA-related protein, partial [Planctomycetota bacterium]
AAAGKGEKPDWKAIYLKIRWLRRRMIMSHPLLDFEKLLVNRRPPTLYSHQCDQYLGRHSRVGAGLTVLSSWKDNPAEKAILEGKLPPGCHHHPDLSYDAKRVLFSFCDHTETNRNYRRFWVYEAAIDGSWVKQLTGTPKDPLEAWEGRRTVLIEDWDPCYVPGGGFLFISTRSQGFGRCHGGRYTPAYLMYRANSDGSDIRQISYGEANEWDPAIMHDGRVIYTRWDYINRHDVRFQSLWTLRPDGTDTRHFYGNYTPNPQVTADVKAIPGSNKVVTTTQGHHSYTAGSIIAVDPRKGEDGKEPVTRITPEACFPESEGWPETPFAQPWPLSEDLYLVACSNEKLVRQGRVQGMTAFGIYLIDTLGGRELVYRDPEISTWAPIPLRPRTEPPVLASMVASKRDKKTGVFWVQNVHQSSQPIAPGTIKFIRINKIIGQPAASQPARGIANNEITKKILGYVPVEADGSVMFRAPAGEPLQFQALDENGMAVMTMRTITYVHPGETQSCVGCHEPRNTTAPRVPYPTARVPKDIQPAAGPKYAGGFRFTCSVQPVLDRHCIRCHGLDRTEGKIVLLGTPTRYSKAYDSIVGRRGMIRLAQRNQETAFSKPKDYFSHAGSFAKMMVAGHPDAKGKARVALDKDDLQRIVDWLDVNTQFYGDYSFNRIEHRKVSSDGEKALRTHVKEMFGEEMSKQPLAALVNYALPTESRVLKAPLSTDAGGWGQVTPVGSNGSWWSREELGYTKTLELVKKVFIPHEHKDVRGTCGRGDRGCRCRSCWVIKAEETYRKSDEKPAEGKTAQAR